MSRRLNLGLAALITLLMTATVLAIYGRATIPDPKSCIGVLLDASKSDSARHLALRRACRRP